MKVPREIDLHDILTAEVKNKAVGKVHHQLVVGRDDYRNVWVLFDLTTAKVVAETFVKELLVQRYVLSYSNVLRVWSNKDE